jgi:23S rRNA (cytosine1962-C5)-methyltransferase
MTFIAEDWKDFAIIECHGGMKKERWGDKLLVRPDPQVLWNNPSGMNINDADAVYTRSTSGGGSWNTKNQLPQSWTIRYKQLQFIVRPTDFKHTGLFPEQAVNWDKTMISIQKAKRPISILNLFGYTGAATIAAAVAGAQVTHVDAAKGMVDWCKQNAQCNGIEHEKIRYIVDDCLKFVQREQRRGKKYDGIIMDPPSYGRGKDGETWKFEKHFAELVKESVCLLSDKPLFFLVNSYTTAISPIVLKNVLTSQLPSGSIEYGELALPIQKQPTMLLPCGITARWTP